MTSSVITFDELEREHEHLKQAAASGPVFVVESGRPDLVVLSFENYERLRTKGPTLGEALSMPFGTPEEVLNFEFPTLGEDMGFRSVDLS